MRILVAGIVILLSGCGVTVINSNPRSVTVEGDSTFEVQAMLKAAEAECQKYKKHAVYNGQINRGTSSFNCVD